MCIGALIARLTGSQFTDSLVAVLRCIGFDEALDDITYHLCLGSEIEEPQKIRRGECLALDREIKAPKDM